MPGFARLGSCVVLAALVAPAAARAGWADDGDPLDALKIVARAKFEAMHRTPAERARELAATAHAGVQTTFQEFQAGKIPPDELFLWLRRELDAKLVQLDKDGDPAPVYEQAWRIAREGEKIAEVKLQAGQIALPDVAQMRLARLQAELDWLAHRGGEGKPAPADPDRLAERDGWPRDKAKAVHADPGQLARERLEAAQQKLNANRMQFEAGKIIPDTVLESVLQVLGAELAMLDKGADPTPLLEKRWKMLREIEQIARFKLEAAKIGAPDLATCRCLRLEAEIAWIRAWKETSKPGRRSPVFLAVEADVADDARWANAKAEASRADVGALLRERSQAAREACQGRRQEFEAGKITPTLALEASLGLLEAEREVAAGPKEEAAALEKHWERALELEAITARKLREGKIAVSDLMEVRYARIQAEIWMTASQPGEDR